MFHTKLYPLHIQYCTFSAAGSECIHACVTLSFMLWFVHFTVQQLKYLFYSAVHDIFTDKRNYSAPFDMDLWIFLCSSSRNFFFAFTLVPYSNSSIKPLSWYLLLQQWYVQYPNEGPWYELLVIPLRFELLCSIMIPISIKVILYMLFYVFTSLHCHWHLWYSVYYILKFK